ncbi:hypothetical protein [Snodgrassella communis]|jgi:plasmid maintenance system killer protein|uniref:hypothetical protein n=1 Tax=Snodgrassella communis TaxID=2946699 RepID=UPI001EF63270|nr:hypothetical protein [Snodgrassella communis]
MKVIFKNLQCQRLFEEIDYKTEINLLAIQNFRMKVNYLFAVKNKIDVENAFFMKLTSVSDSSSYYFLPLNETWKLDLNFQSDDLIEILGINKIGS